MTLKSATQASDIADLNGQMFIEVADVCDGWTLEQRIALAIADFDGGVVHTYTSFVSWESKDGHRFSFEQQTRQDDFVVEEISGEAETDQRHGGKVVLKKPAATEIPLAPGTMFPSRHTALLIASAEAGEVFVNRVVFDGTTPDGPKQIAAFIAKPETALKLADEAAAPRVWPIRLAFYGAEATDTEPEVEIGVQLQASGVTRNLSIDYGAFAIDGRLDRLEILPKTAC